MGAKAGGREDILPSPLLRGVRILPAQGLREVDFAQTGLQVEAVAVLKSLEVSRHAGFEGSRQRDDPVFSPFPVVDGDGSLAEVDVLDSETQRFGLAHAAAVKQRGDQVPGIIEVSQDGGDLLPGQDHGRAAVAGAGRGEFDFHFALAMDVPPQEDDGVEGLPLGRGGDLEFQRQILEVGAGGGGIEGFEIRLAEAAEAEAPESADPGEIGLLRGHREVRLPDGATGAVDLGVDEIFFRWHGVPVGSGAIGSTIRTPRRPGSDSPG